MHTCVQSKHIPYTIYPCRYCVNNLFTVCFVTYLALLPPPPLHYSFLSHTLNLLLSPLLPPLRFYTYKAPNWSYWSPVAAVSLTEAALWPHAQSQSYPTPVCLWFWRKQCSQTLSGVVTGSRPNASVIRRCGKFLRIKNDTARGKQREKRMYKKLCVSSENRSTNWTKIILFRHYQCVTAC